MRLLALLIAALLPLQEKHPAKITALRGAKIYTVAGAPIENATVLIEGGRIIAVEKDLTVPPDATVIEAAGKVVVPGLIDAASRLYLAAGDRSPGSVEQNVLDALDFYQRDGREAVEQGVTTAYVGPVSLGSVNGLGAILHLDAAHTILVRDAALKITLGASGGDTSTAAQRYESYPQLRQVFEAARLYGEAAEKYKRDLAEYEQKKAKKEEAKEPAKPKTDPRQEILLRAFDPKNPLPVRIEVHAADSILLALRLIEDFKLRAVLEYATEGGAAAGALAKAKTPVIVGPVFRTGYYSVDYLNHSVGTAAALVRAGVPVAIGTFGDERAGQSGAGATRFLSESAAVAASAGLTREQALAAITLEAAKALGLEKNYGSIEKGKAADLVILSGEPFEVGTVVERTLIDGAPVFTRGAK